MWNESIFQVALVVGVLWWTHFLSRRVVRAIERTAREKFDDVLNSLYPVFSEKQIWETYKESVAASKKLQQIEGKLLSDPNFKDAARHHKISEDISQQMLNVCEAYVDAEWCWHDHSAMMDANMSVLTGRAIRDEALAIATKRRDITKSMLVDDASKARDEWKLRLEDPASPFKDSAPRIYSNPWFERAKQNFHWSSNAED
jgi:hypothetical protein